MGTLDVAQRVSGDSQARTPPGAGLRLGADAQSVVAARAPDSSDCDERNRNGNGERGFERPPSNPCHMLEDDRSYQRSKGQGRSHKSDCFVPLIKVFAHRFHGARFYSLWSATQ
jgi:hypothetical protein